MTHRQEFGRRDFIKTTAGAAAAVAITGVSSQSQGKETNVVTDHKPLEKVNCFSEDGELKEVIFGRYEDVRIPEYDPIFDFGGPVATAIMKEHGGKMFSEAKPELYTRIQEKSARMVDFLKDRGIVVHRPREHTEDEWQTLRYKANRTLTVISEAAWSRLEIHWLNVRSRRPSEFAISTRCGISRLRDGHRPQVRLRPDRRHRRRIQRAPQTATKEEVDRVDARRSDQQSR